MAGGIRVGLMICTDMWAMNHAIDYGKAAVQLIATPRSTGRPTVEKWLTGGRVVAIVSGAHQPGATFADRQHRSVCRRRREAHLSPVLAPQTAVGATFLLASRSL